MSSTVVEKVIRVDVIASANAAKNIDLIASSMKKIENNADQMRSRVDAGFSGLETTFMRVSSFLGAFGVSLAGGAVVRGILDMASAYEVLNDRLRLVLGSKVAADAAQQDIVDIAVRTGKDLDSTSKLYEKAARAAQQFGKDQGVAGKITEAFANSIRLSGSSTQEAYAAMVQFGQALASGRLQGDEFRSLMENNSVFMYEFAKAAGKSVTELRKLGSEGKLSSDFLFDTMLKKGEDGLTLLERLNKMAAQVPLTFRQSAQSLGTEVTALVGELGKLLSGEGAKDQLGILGPLIRSVQGFTQAAREANIELAAKDGGTLLDKLVAFYKTTGFSPLNPVGSAVNVMRRAQGDFPGDEKPLSARLEDIQKQNEVDRIAAEARKNRASNRYWEDKLSGKEVRAVVKKEYEDALAAMEAVERRIRATNAEIAKLRYGDPYIQKPAEPKKPQEPSKEIKNARDALNDYIKKMQEENEVERRLRDSKEDTLGTMKDVVRLDKLARDAKIPLTSARLEEVRALIRSTEAMKQAREAADALRKSRNAESETAAKEIQRWEDLIKKDEAAIEAMAKKRRPLQEYGTEQIEDEITRTLEKIDALTLFSRDATDPALREAYDLLDVLQRALKVRRELEGKQDAKRSFEEQDRIEGDKIKKQKKLADEINDQLKQGIINGKGSGSIGDQLLKNIKDTFRNKTIDIVINPVTSLISQVLAQLANEFSSAISRALMEGIANRAADPIGALAGMKTGEGNLLGSLFSFMGGFWPFATGISNVPYDGMRAELHRGERVLTAQENREYNAAPREVRTVNITSAPVINIDSRTDAAAVRQDVSRAIELNNKRFLEELNAQGVL